MYNKKMYGLGSRRSVIRELFEYGKALAAKIGSDKVFDFSLGNPNVAAPSCVNESLIKILTERDSTSVHGYTSAQGDLGARKAISAYINKRFDTTLTENEIYITVGAAASLTILLNALNEDNDEFITFAPFFPEYKVFAEAAGGTLKVIPCDTATFQPSAKDLADAISERTKAVIINSPNNPSGVVYSEQTISAIVAVLKAKSEQFGHPIFLISDEPYREIVYNNLKVPYVMNYYDNSIVCYSYSKSLSLPGERIGYIAINNKAEDYKGLYAAICGAGRALGYVCAPSLMQYMVRDCLEASTNVAAYEANRDLLYNSLVSFGYSCVHPDGAFYLFVKALEQDAVAFSNRAKELGLLVVPSDDFGVEGYCRIAYCVSNDMIKRSLPYFKTLIESYNK